LPLTDALIMVTRWPSRIGMSSATILYGVSLSSSRLTKNSCVTTTVVLMLTGAR
jgi:hypothetical protein